MKKHRIRTRKPTTASNTRPLALSVLYAAALSLGIGVAALLALCAVLLQTEDPLPLACTAASLLPLPIAFLSGLLSAHSCGRTGLLSGACGGAMLCLLLLALGLLCPQGTAESSPLLSPPLMAGMCLALSALGGYLVTHRTPRLRRRAHRK